MKQINFLLLINVFLFINNVCYSMDNTLSTVIILLLSGCRTSSKNVHI